MSPAHAAQQAEARGTVKSVDAKGGRVKIAHEAIKSLGWPAMTMDFELTDKTMLDQLKPEQQEVVFTFVQRDGRYVITSIKPQG
ncbi:copper-binding protein [Sulfurifustis variabilis]|uniref:copper-binding protein n=1 Tax=Sulfurifustis variabilis TaxID=1675686 RepID=UPI0022B26BCB|nr:copper-binding protein [Sulfurifustis variabilis]